MGLVCGRPRPWLVLCLAVAVGAPLVGASTAAVEGPTLRGHAIGVAIASGLSLMGPTTVADTGPVETRGSAEASAWWPAPPSGQDSPAHLHATVQSDGEIITAAATVAEHVIDLPVGELRVRDLRVTAAAGCDGMLEGSTTLSTVTLDGDALYPGAQPGPNTAIPLGAATTLFLNRQMTAGNNLTVVALELRTALLVGGGTPLQVGVAMAGAEACPAT